VMSGVAVARIGETVAEPRLRMRCGRLILEATVQDIRQAWQGALPELLGES